MLTYFADMEAEKEHRRQRRKAIKSQKGLTEPPRLGKVKYEKAPVQVGGRPCPVKFLAFAEQSTAVCNAPTQHCTWGSCTNSSHRRSRCWQRVEEVQRALTTGFLLTEVFVQVLLSSEITGSLRKLKAAPMLAKDRFKSLQKSGLIEPRLPAVQKRKNKRKTYIQGERGERIREGHANLMNARQGKH
jgi:hypothetical protein